jgi:hypothetical protein
MNSADMSADTSADASADASADHWLQLSNINCSQPSADASADSFIKCVQFMSSLQLCQVMGGWERLGEVGRFFLYKMCTIHVLFAVV